jgi:hypothetical protein
MVFFKQLRWDRCNWLEVFDYLRDRDFWYLGITVTRRCGFCLIGRKTLGVAVNEVHLRLVEPLYIGRGAPGMVSWLLRLFLFDTQIIHALFNLINFLDESHNAFVSFLNFLFKLKNLSLFGNLWYLVIIWERTNSCVTDTNSTAIDLRARKVGAESAHVVIAELLLWSNLDGSWEICGGIVCAPFVENYWLDSLATVIPIYNFFSLTLVNVIIAKVLFFGFLNLRLNFLYHLKSISLHFALWSVRSLLIWVNPWIILHMLDNFLYFFLLLALVIWALIEYSAIPFWRIYRGSQFLWDFLWLTRDLLLSTAVGNSELFWALVILSLSGEVRVGQDLVFKVKSVLELTRVFNRRARLGTPFLKIIKTALDKLYLFLIDFLSCTNSLLHADTFL